MGGRDEERNQVNKLQNKRKENKDPVRKMEEKLEPTADKILVNLVYHKMH